MRRLNKKQLKEKHHHAVQLDAKKQDLEQAIADFTQSVEQAFNLLNESVLCI